MKKLISLALASTLALSLVACSSSTTESSSGSTTTTTTPTVSADATTVVYWSMWESTEPQGIVIQQAADAFYAETGIYVDVEFKGRTGQREGLEPALDAGTTIDIFDEDIERVNVTWGRFTTDLEELAAAAGYEDTANSALVATSRELSIDGNLRTIAYQPSVMAWFYHPDIFDEAGITELPTTWDEFLAVCQAVKDAGYIPLTNDNAYMTAVFGTHLAHYVGDDGVADIVTNLDWENPAVLAAAEDFEELATLGYFSPNIESNVWPSGQNTEFALGQVAMYYNGSWVANEVRGMTGDGYEWGVFGYPELEGGINGTEAANFGGQCFAISDASTVKEEAFDFIMYLTRGDWDTTLAVETMGIPAEATNESWPVEIAAAKDVMDNLETRYSWAGGLETNVDATPALQANIQKLCGGSITAEEFVAAMIAST